MQERSRNRDASPGIRFGKYLIKKKLASGGMGEVFLADQLGPLGPVRPVALKRLLPKLSRNDDATQLFLKEMTVAAQLNHPNIATTYDFGDVGGQYFIAMEYVDGISLQALLQGVGPLPVAAAVEIIASVADALDYAHERRAPTGRIEPVVHRDVSPHNIMVTRDGVVKLLDFGIALAEARVEGGFAAGKLAYAPPEQLLGEPPDRRSDLWALGVVLFETLTGMRPFVGQTPQEIFERAQAGKSDPVDRSRPESAPIAHVVTQALLPDPAMRWPSAAAFALALREQSGHWVQRAYEGPAALVAQVLGPPRETEAQEGETAMRAVTAHVEGPVAPPSEPPALPTVVVQTKTFVASDAGSAAATSGGTNVTTWAVGAGAMTVLVVGALWALRLQEPDVIRIEAESTYPHIADIEKNKIAEPARIERSENLTARVATTTRGASTEPTSQGELPPSVQPAPVDEARVAPLQPLGQRPRASAKPVRTKSSDVQSKPRATTHVDGLGLLSVRAVPWARVAIDGSEVGSSPIANHPISTGSHVLTLVTGESAEQQKTLAITIKKGELLRVIVDFTRDSVRMEPTP